MKNSTLTKIALIIFFLTLSVMAFGQEKTETTYTIKSIVKERQIVGYLVVTISKEKKVVKTERITTYTELESRNLRRQAKAKIDLNKVPTENLNLGEYLKNGVRNNGF